MAESDDRPLIPNEEEQVDLESQPPATVPPTFDEYVDEGCLIGIPYWAGSFLFGIELLLELAVAIAMIVVDHKAHWLIFYGVVWVIFAMVRSGGILLGILCKPEWMRLVIYAYGIDSLVSLIWIVFGFIGCAFLNTPVPLLIRLQLEQFMANVDDSTVRLATVGVTAYFILNRIFSAWRVHVCAIEYYRRIVLINGYDVGVETRQGTIGSSMKLTITGSHYESAYQFARPIIIEVPSDTNPVE